jgi:hypothetical protein
LKSPDFRKFGIAAFFDASRWIFLAALIYAPWAYGGTTDSSITGINWLVSFAVALWLLEMAVTRRKPNLSFGLTVPCAVILILGWFAACNPSSVYDSEIEIFAPMREYFSAAPSSADAALSVTAMVRTTLLLAATLFVADISRHPRWLFRVWVTVGLAGFSIALLGLSQRATGAVLPFWEYQPDESSSFFATYYYHANAGAFLNLVLPLTAGLALRAFDKSGLRVQKAVWLAATVLLLASIFTNTSRAAQFLGLITTVALAIGPAKRIWGQTLMPNRRIFALTAVVSAGVIFAIVHASGIAEEDARWRRATEEIPNDTRWKAYKVALDAIPDASWTGFGPGTFPAIFPHYWRLPTQSTGRWDFLHQDGLQTILEWGWAGAASWAAIFVGGMIAGMVSLRRLRKVRLSPRHYRILPLALIALVAVALHSLVDFPLQVFSLQLYAATYLGTCWGSLKPLAVATLPPKRTHLEEPGFLPVS